MEIAIKYRASGSNEEQQILIPHITRVLYDPSINQVSIVLIYQQRPTHYMNLLWKKLKNTI
jgi:hypothetical protein